MMTSIFNKKTRTDDYGDLLQYEWTGHGGSTSSWLRFAEGPAPNAPNILWKAKVPGFSTATARNEVFAFNGKVFVITSTTLYALDAFTGNTVWTFPAGRGAGVAKLDEIRMMIGNTCVEIETGTSLWVSPQVSIGYFALYCQEEKMSYSPGGIAYDFSDPTQPPTLAWDISNLLEKNTITIYGDGMLFAKGPNQFITAFNATTGEFIWEIPIKAASNYQASYYMGKYIHGALDNTISAWDGATGELLWSYNPGTAFGFWASGTGAAYGKVYSMNQDKNLYAIDVETGEVVWKYEGPGVYYQGIPIIADGKVYAQTGDTLYMDPDTHEPGKSEYVCLDAETGKLLWKLPIQIGSPSPGQCVAFGNLYLIPNRIKLAPYAAGARGYDPLDEVWCISSEPKDWTNFRGDPENSAHGSGPTNLALKWKYQTGGGVTSSPSIADGVVYVGSLDKNIYALDADTGSKIWNFTTGYRVRSSPAVVDGTVITGADDGNVYGLDAKDGTQLWKTPAGGITLHSSSATPSIRSSPTVVGGKVYVGSLDNNLYCLNANTGSVSWKFPAGGPILCSPAVVDDAVYFTSNTPRPKGILYKLDAYDGSVIWQLNITYGRSPDLFASPTVADGMVFVPADSWDQYGINATTGAIEWTYRGTSMQFNFASMVYANGKVYTQDLFAIMCLNSTDGTVIWQTFLAREIYGSITYSLGRIYTSNEQRAVYVLDAETGEKLSFYDLGSMVWSTPNLYNGRVYIGGQDWNVYCLEEYEAPAIVSAEIDLSLSESTVVKGESLYIEGRVVNVQAAIPLTVSVDYPDSTYDDIELLTDVNGYFQVIYSPRMVGDLTVFAWCEGGDFYYGGASDALSLTVANPEPTLPPDPTPAPMTDTYVVGTGIAVIAAIAVAVLLILRKK